MNDKQRRWILLASLAGVVAWSAWLAVNDATSEAETDLVEVAEPAVDPGVRPAAVPTATPRASQEATPRLALARANLFPEQTWYVPPPPPPPPPPAPPPPLPPPPQAPPLPFSYMGRWHETGQTTYYLTRGNTPVNVRVGEVLDGMWRLESVNGGLLNFTYLPLNQTRTLRTGD